MLDIGMSELILIGVVALIVVGPKDLPRMFHALGRMTGKARGMAREFQRAMDDAAKSSGLDEVRKDINGLRTVTSPGKLGISALEQAADRFDKWDAGKAIKTVTNGAAAAAPAAAASVVTVAPPAAGTEAAAVAAAATVGPATAALAEQKAAEQAAARQKALELQAQRTAEAAKKWAAKAAETTTAAAATEPAPTVEDKPALPRGRRAKTAETTASAPAGAEDGAEAKPKPARKPPVRAKKSDT